MRSGSVLKFALVGMLALWVAAASAQQIFYPGFTSVANLAMNSSKQATYNGVTVLRISNGYLGKNVANPEVSTTWFNIQQPVNSGFTTYFQFQIHNPALCCNPGDGLAFVVQNSSWTDSTYGATGKGLTAKGTYNGGLGYAGIPNSLAVEFDTFFDNWDYTGGSNHVAVQGCGIHTNGPVHDPNGVYTIGKNTNVRTCLVGNSLTTNVPTMGMSCNETQCTDGALHQVVIEYGQINGVWTLRVWVDPKFIMNTHTPTSNSIPAINIPYNIDASQNPVNGISLAKDAKGSNTLAWVGFTASRTDEPQAVDILYWEFTPHTPTTVQQQIANGGTTTTFNFGANDTTVKYFPSFVNQNGCDGMQQNGVFCLMTVLATPTDRNVFYQTRLLGTNFENEECVLYQGTGGNCMVYTITCQNSNALTTNVTCPVDKTGTCVNGGNQSTCITFSTGFDTTDGVSQINADYLKAPATTNGWKSIFTMFSQGPSDPRTTGTGGTTSDFVATYVPGGQRP